VSRSDSAAAPLTAGTSIGPLSALARERAARFDESGAARRPKRLKGCDFLRCPAFVIGNRQRDNPLDTAFPRNDKRGENFANTCDER
jgi:hypothetical protein